MAARIPPSHDSASADDSQDSAIGLDHLTVVPANFDPEENGLER